MTPCCNLDQVYGVVKYLSFGFLFTAGYFSEGGETLLAMSVTTKLDSRRGSPEARAWSWFHENLVELKLHHIGLPSLSDGAWVLSQNVY